MTTSNYAFIFVFINLFFIAALVFVVLYTIKNIRKREQEKYELKINFQKMISKSMIESSDLERRNIAMILHDDILPSLSITNMQFEGVRGKEEAEQLKMNMKEIIHKIRNLSHETSPVISSHNLLDDEIFEIIHKYQNSNINFDFSSEIDFKNLDKNIQYHLLLILKELIHNSIKHASCSQISIHFKNNSLDHFEMIYKDNGMGMEKIPKEQSNLQSLGFNNIFARLQILNANHSIVSSLNNGFKIEIKL